jgi:hypothetical protein
MTNPVLLGGEPGQNVQRPAERNKRKEAAFEASPPDCKSNPGYAG